MSEYDNETSIPNLPQLWLPHFISESTIKACSPKRPITSPLQQSMQRPIIYKSSIRNTFEVTHMTITLPLSKTTTYVKEWRLTVDKADLG